VEQDGTKYSFRITSETFTLGAVLLVDTVTMDINGKHDFVLDEGNHVIEFYGASATDTVTTMEFAVNDGNWLEWTTKNFEDQRSADSTDLE